MRNRCPRIATRPLDDGNAALRIHCVQVAALARFESIDLATWGVQDHVNFSNLPGDRPVKATSSATV